MFEVLKHSLGLCGEPHGILFWILTGTATMFLMPFKTIYYTLVKRIKNESTSKK